MGNKKIEFNSLKIEELEDLFLSLGEKKFRAEQFFRFMHQKKNFEIENCKQLPKVLIEKLKEIGYINTSSIYTKYESKLDNTKKYLIKLYDNRIIETVFMDYGSYCTVCISSQVGCRMGCTFCASTKENFKRKAHGSGANQQAHHRDRKIDGDRAKKRRGLRKGAQTLRVQAADV